MDGKAITFFATTNFRNESEKFGIKDRDRRCHFYVIGRTGMGKATLLENLIISDIQAGQGLAVIDPHGNLALKILDYIPSWRVGTGSVHWEDSRYMAEKSTSYGVLQKRDTTC